MRRQASSGWQNLMVKLESFSSFYVCFLAWHIYFIKNYYFSDFFNINWSCLSFIEFDGHSVENEHIEVSK